MFVWVLLFWFLHFSQWWHLSADNELLEKRGKKFMALTANLIQSRKNPGTMPFFFLLVAPGFSAFLFLYFTKFDGFLSFPFPPALSSSFYSCYLLFSAHFTFNCKLLHWLCSNWTQLSIMWPQELLLLPLKHKGTKVEVTDLSSTKRHRLIWI